MCSKSASEDNEDDTADSSLGNYCRATLRILGPGSPQQQKRPAPCGTGLCNRGGASATDLSARGARRALAGIVCHERLAAATSWLGKRWLAGSEITTRCTCITTGRKAATACVTKTRFAAIAFTITTRRKTTVTTTVITTRKTASAFTTCRSTTVVTASETTAKATTETTTVIATTCGTTEAATRLVVTVVVRTARGATATTKIATARCLRRALRVLHAGNHFGLELLAAVRLNVVDLAAIAELGKRDGQAIATRTASTANAVGVVLGLHGQAEVEHMGDRGHIDATCCHIGSHQNLHLAIAQCHQTAIAQTLAQGTVQCNGRKAFLLQVVGQAIALHLGAGKNDGLVDRGVTQPVVQHLALVLGVVGPVQHLLDVGMLLLRRVNGDLLHRRTSVVHHAHGQLLDAGREGSAEHHGLLALGGQLVQFGQVVRETQVEHAVGFVNDQELHLVELDLHRALQVQQAARGGHHQVGVLQLGDLQLVRHATHHVSDTQATAVLDQVDSIVRDLLRQFTRGAQNQGTRGGGLEIARAGGVLALGALGGRFTTGGSFGHSALESSAFFGFGSSLLVDQRVQHGQQEGGSLAAAGLAGNHQVDELGGVVATAHCQGNGLELHAGGLGVAQVSHGLHQFRGQAQFDKAVGFSSHGNVGLGDSCHHGVQRGRLHGNVGSKGSVGRREFALHQRGVGHDFSLTKTIASVACEWLRQWLKNINHQTKPALLWADAGGRCSLVLHCVENSRLASPVCEGRCTICEEWIPAQPLIMAWIGIFPQAPLSSCDTNPQGLQPPSPESVTPKAGACGSAPVRQWTHARLPGPCASALS